MNSSESAKLLAVAGGDTVKLVDISPKVEDDCVLAYSPSPGSSVNSVKWNHNNMVLASAGDDGKVSFWRRNGTRLLALPCKNDGGGTVESISTINFCNKGSRYLCSGGTGQVVRIWDLQSKRCIKWLKGHTDTITGVMCNCKDEHVASVSRKGELIVHSLVSGAKAAELKDPQGQVLVALDYSRVSRHLLVTGGDDGSVHLWDTTGHNPKVSWSKQHSAPVTGVAFSPTNDKIIASVGLDMKLYTFDTGSRKPSSCIHHEAPFSTLAYSDDGLNLAAATTTGQVVLYDVRSKPQPVTALRVYGDSEAITNLCWQRSKPVTFNKSSLTDETVLLAGDVGDSIIMPDPLPSRSSASGFMTSEEQPRVGSSLINPTLARLNAPHNNVMDDMEVFSPIVEVQPLTPSFDKLWDDHDGPEKDKDGNPGFLLPSRRFGLSEEAAGDENPIFNMRPSSSSKQVDNNTPSTFSRSTPNLAPARTSSGTPRKGWGGEKALEKFIHKRQSTKMPSRFAKSTPPSSSMGLMPHATNLHGRETSHQEASLSPSEAALSAVRTKTIIGQDSIDAVDPAAASPRRYSSYAERILGAAASLPVGSPKSKKTGSETREEILNNLLSNSQPATPTTSNGGDNQLQKISLQSDSEKSFVAEETLASFRESIHGDMQNLHLEILRQFHMQEMGMSSVMRLILDNQAEIMQEIQSLREEIQHFHHLL
ncbi:protein NEDD1-like [Salvia miltiorrhiza]|uniref:protein NEDD1-like n=1 Tax=Salvia miltiorrhiza TaxID=226208 RepID=UPI0025AC95CC|nr:protein NEDD1-like [Salvia miltiorrhiza]